MARALMLAREAQRQGEVPVGAVIVKNSEIIGEGFNRSIALCDPSAHAEIMTIREGGKQIQNYRLNCSTLYISLEPCVMCAGAILQARISRVVFATWDHRFGAAGSTLNLLESKFLNHQCRVQTGVLESEAKDLLQAFFADKR